MQVLRCNACGKWVGNETGLDIEFKNGLEREVCPKCGAGEALMDLDHGCHFTDSELERLWELFGEVLIDDDEGIGEEFLGFEEGTNRNEIWCWFDERHSKGTVHLMHVGNRRRICKRCGTVREYPYYCPKCDENKYSFECKEA